MALSLGKLTILLGAGLFGGAMASKEGGLADFSGLVSGAFKVFLRQLQSNDSTPTVKKPHNDVLLDQVSNLRKQIEDLVRDNKDIIIVNSSGTEGKKYAAVVIIGVGCGCLWWKGWIPHMMFATRRSLNDACTGIGKQLGKVYESIEKAKVQIGGEIIRVESNIDKIEAIGDDTQNNINAIQRETEEIGGDINKFRIIIRTIEDKITLIEGNQVATNDRVKGMCLFTESLQNGSTPQYIQGSSSMPAIELPPVSPSSRALQSGPSRLYLEQPSITPISRTGSVPPTRSADPPSPSNTVGSDQESSPISDERGFSSSRVDSMKTPTGNKINESSSGGFLGINFSSVYAPLLRTRSVTGAVLQQTRPSS